MFFSCFFILASQLNSDLLKSDPDLSNECWKKAALFPRETCSKGNKGNQKHASATPSGLNCKIAICGNGSSTSTNKLNHSWSCWPAVLPLWSNIVGKPTMKADWKFIHFLLEILLVETKRKTQFFFIKAFQRSLVACTNLLNCRPILQRSMLYGWVIWRVEKNYAEVLSSNPATMVYQGLLGIPY